jgi:branched-chain amino acid transport system substrate-binding protein
LEVAIDILKRSKNPLDRESNRAALVATKIETVVGKVDFSSGPHPNISKTPIFGGQWVKGSKWPCDLKIVDNAVNKLFTPEQHMKLMSWPA